MSRRAGVVVRADGGFIGSQTNLIMVTMTGLTLAAGRFGLAPTVKRGTTAGLKLVDRSNAAGIMSNDPSGERGRARQERGRERDKRDKRDKTERPAGKKPDHGSPFLLSPLKTRQLTSTTATATHHHQNNNDDDDAGFTIVDTLALGALGHVLGVGIVLGLRATGGL